MSGVFVGLTVLIVAVTVVLVIAGFYLGIGALKWVGAGVALACAIVWILYRPTVFEVDATALRITWPARRSSVSRADIVSARVLHDPAEAKDLLGTGFRIGVGGLFGTFGLIWSKKLGMVSVYVTRPEEMVLIERRGKRPLLLTPTDATGFVEALGYEA